MIIICNKIKCILVFQVTFFLSSFLLFARLCLIFDPFLFKLPQKLKMEEVTQNEVKVQTHFRIFLDIFLQSNELNNKVVRSLSLILTKPFDRNLYTSKNMSAP